MHNTLLLCTVELLLFKGVLAAPDTLPNKNHMRVHERIEYNRHILHDDEDPNSGSDDGSQCNGYTASTDYPSVATGVPSLPTIFACGAQQPQQDSVTTIYLDGDQFDDDADYTDTDDVTIWQTLTATETDIYGDCGCAAPTPDALPVITSYAPQPIVQTICPMVAAPPPSISICTVAVPTTVVAPAPIAIVPSSPCNNPPPAPSSDDDSSDPSYDDEPEVATPACGCGTMDIDYEHPFGDDTVDWVLDTKDHTRHRWENFKDRADRALSHVRPSHVHDRVSQVLHDGRPARSDEHRNLHKYRGNAPVQDRRARARYNRRLRNSRARYPYTYERDYDYYEPYVREPVRDSRRARGPARRTPELVPVRGAAAARARGPAPQRQRQRGSMRDSCGAPPPPMRDTCRAPQGGCGGSDYEHQYGDDTMNFVLDTKDHSRHFYNRVKDRTKKALSHFSPSHMHDRVDQFVHEERPGRTEDHLEVHEQHGYY